MAERPLTLSNSSGSRRLHTARPVGARPRASQARKQEGGQSQQPPPASLRRHPALPARSLCHIYPGAPGLQFTQHNLEVSWGRAGCCWRRGPQAASEEDGRGPL